MSELPQVAQKRRLIAQEEETKAKLATAEQKKAEDDIATLKSAVEEAENQIAAKEAESVLGDVDRPVDR